MAAAAAAMHFRARHAMAAVDGGLHRTGLRIVEAGPAGAALELFLRDEQRLSASGTGKSAGALLVVQRAAARRLGAVRAHDAVLLGCELRPPFRVRVSDRELLGIHGRP